MWCTFALNFLSFLGIRDGCDVVLGAKVTFLDKNLTFCTFDRPMVLLVEIDAFIAY